MFVLTTEALGKLVTKSDKKRQKVTKTALPCESEERVLNTAAATVHSHRILL